MGVNITGAIYKGFTFDGVNSKDYGVYITGEGVYNAPERDTETIAIPGRNGAFVRDNGRFENITVTYTAGMFGDSQTDFADGINALRNALCSRVGYKRLTDEYNANEYREAVYKSGLDVSPEAMSRAGKFNIVFECKPQRFLTSGETAASVANNGTVTNPTLFDAKPLLQFTASGAGNINLGSNSISFISSDLGDIPLSLVTAEGSATGYDPVSNVIITNTGDYNTGNTLTISGNNVTTNFIIKPPSGKSVGQIQLGTSTGITGRATISGNAYLLVLRTANTTFTAGTSSTVTKTLAFSGSLSDHTSFSGTFTVYITYNGSTTIQYKWLAPTITNFTIGATSPKVSGSYTGSVYSTKNTLSGTLYIDLDIGEAYRVQNNNAVSINNYVNLGAELPTLPPGNTTVTYSNTISNFKITPRWWRV